MIGFPAGSYIGLAFTSIFDVATAGSSAPETGREAFALPSFPSFFNAAGFCVISFDTVLWAMLRISLYRAFLEGVNTYAIRLQPQMLLTMEVQL